MRLCDRPLALPIHRTLVLLLLAGLSAATLVGQPIAGHAQQPEKVYRVGMLDVAAPDPARTALWNLFKQTLRERDFIEGSNIQFDLHWANGRQELLPGLAADLVRHKVDVIVTAGTPTVTAASRATTSVPIVMATGTAPTARNVVGVIDTPPGLSAKRLQLLKQALPRASCLAILADRGNPSSPPAVRETIRAAKSLKIAVGDYWVRSPDEIGGIVAAMKRKGARGFVTAPGGMFFAQRQQIATLAIKHHLPAMAVRSDYAEAGFLLAYGAPIRENYRQAALYVERILKGAKPSTLPAFQPSELELVINLKTAKALGLTIPRALLAGARTIDR